MIKQGRDLSAQDGFALMYMAAALTLFCLATGLAVDSGRAYVVKAQLSKAVDGAALAAARNLNTGNPSLEAAKIFRANFPVGYFGTSSSTDPYTDPNFFSTHVVGATGVNVVNVTASAIVPTTFMKLGGFSQVTVTSSGEAQRRLVDLSLVLDVSGSIGAQWSQVRLAAQAFVNSFDATQDRLSLLFYGDAGRVLDMMPAGRGFDKAGMIAHIPATLPGGSTAMVEGLYRGWDELRSVPISSRSGLRVIVLFTDGASNSVPGNWDGTGIAKGLRTYDYPHIAAETTLPQQTHDAPSITGEYDTQAYPTVQSPAVSLTPSKWDQPDTPYSATHPTWPRWMPAKSLHTHHRSGGIPTAFDLQTALLTVDGSPQSTARKLINPVSGQYPAQIININNAARNLVEIIADAAREETELPSARVRIYTIGMGDLVQYNLGTRKETSASILKRIANDPDGGLNVDYKSTQLQGAFYYATTAADVAAAFQALQNQIVRLSK